MKKKILISDSIDPVCISILSAAGFNVDYSPGLHENELKNIIDKYNVLIVRSATRVNFPLIDNMNSMEIIGRAGTGVDNIDISSATRKGILVINTPGGNTISAAEHTIAMILAVCRFIPQSNQLMKLGKWERKNFQGTELSGKTLGLIGLGKIGKEVALRAKAFGMKILTYDPLVSLEILNETGAELVDFQKVISSSDIISVHTPLTEKTRHMIGKNEFSNCKPGIKIINCARGGIIDEEELLIALKNGKVSAAGIDVFENEPPELSSELFNHPNVVCTPHLGASTEEAQKKVAIQIAEQIIEYYKNGSLSGAVNAFGLKNTKNKEVEPYISLAQTLGKINGQLIKSRLKKMNIICNGELLHQNADTIINASLQGFLSEKLDQPVNLINSRMLAQESGIVFNIIRSGELSEFINLLTIEVETETNNRLIAGTVYGSSEIRIVKIDDYLVEIKPVGNFLIYNNVDRPGMLASVSKILASHSINIAGLTLGRIKQGENALTVINVDEKIPDKIFSEISMIEGIHNIYTVSI